VPAGFISGRLNVLPVPYFHVVFTLPEAIARHRAPEQEDDL